MIFMPRQVMPLSYGGYTQYCVCANIWHYYMMDEDSHCVTPYTADITWYLAAVQWPDNI